MGYVEHYQLMDTTGTSLNVGVEILNIIGIIFGILFTIIYIFQHIHSIVAIFSDKRKWKKAKVNHKYGFLIAGRNESTVIGNLIDSIFQMDYPKDLIQVFVCADNCTDETAKIAREHGAVVFERFNNQLIGKSYAMDFLVKSILSNHSYDDIEAFVVMDADNLVSKTYLKELNKTFDAGYKVSTSFRESKNFDTNWVSGCSSLTFYRECCLVHHSRDKLGIGTYVSGTGYFMAREILEELGGWNFNTMTEDIEFSIWCATHNILISFNEDAVFYDEQPENLKVANTQRLRWCKGTHQCYAKYNLDLMKGMVSSNEKLTCFELFSHVTPFPIITLAWLILYVMLHGILTICGIEDPLYFLDVAVTNICGFLLMLILVSQEHAAIATYKNRERLKPYNMWFKIECIILFPIYVSMFIPLSIKALFKRNVKWQHIPHTNGVSIDKFEKAKS